MKIESVYGLVLELFDRELNNKLNIPIAEIKTLRQNGWKTNDLATFIFTIAGVSGGSIAGIFIDIGLFATPWGTKSNNCVYSLIYLVSIGGGARIGYKLGKSIFKRRYKAVEFEGWTLDKNKLSKFNNRSMRILLLILFNGIISITTTLYNCLLNAINHYYVKDSKKMLKYTLLVMLPFLAIGVLGMEYWMYTY